VTASGLPIVAASGAASGGRLASSCCHAGGIPCPRTSFGAPGLARPTVLPIVFDCPLSIPCSFPFLRLSPSHSVEPPFLEGGPKMGSLLNPPATMYLRPLSSLFLSGATPVAPFACLPLSLSRPAIYNRSTCISNIFLLPLIFTSRAVPYSSACGRSDLAGWADPG
jgi:hypothetical protein